MKNNQLATDFQAFLDNHPPGEFSASLRRMLLDYLRVSTRLGLPVGFEDFLHGLYDLFELLDLAEDEKAGG